jgi:hypothetical protein
MGAFLFSNDTFKCGRDEGQQTIGISISGDKIELCVLQEPFGGSDVAAMRITTEAAHEKRTKV